MSDPANPYPMKSSQNSFSPKELEITRKMNQEMLKNQSRNPKLEADAEVVHQRLIKSGAIQPQ